jgi:hypothetical protein
MPWRSKHPLLIGHTKTNVETTVYGTNHSVYGPVIICNSKQGHYSDRRICEIMTLNEIPYNPATSIFLSSWPRFE